MTKTEADGRRQGMLPLGLGATRRTRRRTALRLPVRVRKNGSLWKCSGNNSKTLNLVEGQPKYGKILTKVIASTERAEGIGPTVRAVLEQAEPTNRKAKGAVPLRNERLHLYCPDATTTQDHLKSRGRQHLVSYGISLTSACMEHTYAYIFLQ